MGMPNGLHHIALNVHDVEGALEFFTQACGMELKAFYWMHGFKDAYHIFLKLNERSYVALARVPADDGVEQSPEQRDVLGMDRVRGNMQHIAFNVDGRDELLAMRDRVRSHGYMTFGPIDHGFCESVYIPKATEGMMVEFSCSEQEIDPERWVLDSTLEHAGLSKEKLQRFLNPPPFEPQGGAVPQPAYNAHLQPGLQERICNVLSDPDALAALEKAAAEPA